MPSKTPLPHEIDRLIGSPAYRDTRHPLNASTHKIVENWFAARYSTNNCVNHRTFTLFRYGCSQNLRHNHIVYRVLNGKTLLVGEGNFSFTASLVFDHNAIPSSITSTIHESSRNISDIARANAKRLSEAGVTVIDSVDATHLDRTFHHQKFDTVIFQFPNAGSREPNRGHNPNYVLVRRFLRSAAEHLRQAGEIIVTIVNSSYYDGRFRMDEAAEYAGIRNFYAIPFSPVDFPSYSHVNTNDDDSALKEHRSFETWILQP